MNVLETIAGQVILKEGLTTFYCDSATINRHTNIMEAFGNVHINQHDSIHTYAQYLKYVGAERTAYLKKDVKLTDKKGTLFTQELEYNLQTNIGKYTGGGKVVNGKTVLTSENGVYYADTKDVYFKNNVHLVDSKYNITSDSLLYNTQTQISTFISPTYINSKNGGKIYTTSGTYDMKNGKAYFANRTIIDDSTRKYAADVINYDENKGAAKLEGNAIVVDSINGYTIMGNQIFYNKKDSSFLSTGKPVLIFKGEANDSTYITADTLFSGVYRKSFPEKNKSKDSLVSKIPVLIKKDTITMNYNIVDSAGLMGKRSDVTLIDDSSWTNHQTDTSANFQLTSKDNKGKRRIIQTSATDSTVRFFQAFHHVRIYNDSIQAVSDSLFYSSEDSVFRLYQSPLVFSKHSQISGDTMYLYIKNKKAKRLYVFENAMIINVTKEGMYNQIAGRTINGYFKNGEFDFLHVKGSPAESVFYPQDEDSAYLGMNRSKGDVIDVYFINQELRKVKFINDVDGVLYPMKQIPEDQKFLKHFIWQEQRRPKNKMVMFE